VSANGAIAIDDNDANVKALTTQTSTVVRDAHGRVMKGSGAVHRGGSRPKRIREFEALLNKEHRNMDKMRELFNRLRALAMGDIVLVPVCTAEGTIEVKAELHADARFMQLYLDRLLGPAKAFEDDFDLSDAPSEVIEYLRVRVQR